jgi:GntR family transcriptional repressor for pyruvate dehydrogenase complex
LDIDFAPVARNTVSEEIIKQVISMINTGKLRPGSKLPSEREMMEKFQVSRSSVREALHSLKMIGILETTPGAGTFVSNQMGMIAGGQLEWAALLGSQELQELIEVREPLEVQAAGLAAERASQEQIQEFKQAIDAFVTSKSDQEAFLAAELNVHMTLARISGNQTLFRIIQIFQDQLKDYRANHKIVFSNSTSAQVEYQDILVAIEAGDASAARDAMQRHLQTSKQQALVNHINRNFGLKEVEIDKTNQ